MTMARLLRCRFETVYRQNRTMTGSRFGVAIPFISSGKGSGR